MNNQCLNEIAIFISLISLLVSIFVALRDRRSATATARHLDSFQKLSDGIYVHIVNSGRRPITLRRLVIKSNGNSHEHVLRHENKTIRLLESEDYEFQLSKENSEFLLHANKPIKNAYIEDSHGKKYAISDFVKIFNRHWEI